MSVTNQQSARSTVHRTRKSQFNTVVRIERLPYRVEGRASIIGRDQSDSAAHPTPFPGDNASGRKSVHCLISCAEVENEWSHTSTPYPPLHTIRACTGTNLNFIHSTVLENSKNKLTKLKSQSAKWLGCMITEYFFFFLSSMSFYLTMVRCRGVTAFDHTQGHTTVGRIPLDEGSARDSLITDVNDKCISMGLACNVYINCYLEAGRRACVKRKPAWKKIKLGLFEVRFTVYQGCTHFP
jgi:hypothetical protein